MKVPDTIWGQGQDVVRRKDSFLNLSMDVVCQLDISGHYGDSLSVDCMEIGILKESHEV